MWAAALASFRRFMNRITGSNEVGDGKEGER